MKIRRIPPPLAKGGGARKTEYSVPPPLAKGGGA
jgi:hypothetical protein